MSYDDVEIEDMEWNEDLGAYTYPCPCGDLFQITKVGHRLPYVEPRVRYTRLLESLPQLCFSQEELAAGEEIARCPSCSLYITVVYDPVRVRPFKFDLCRLTSSEALQPLTGFTCVAGSLSGPRTFSCKTGDAA